MKTESQRERDDQLTEIVKRNQKKIVELKNTITETIQWRPGTVVHACNPSALGGPRGRIT